MVQLSHPYMTTRKTIALTRRNFVGKVMSLLFNTSKFVKALLPRSKRLLISWLQSLSTVILEPKKIVCHCFHCFPIYLPWSDGLDAMTLIFWMLSFKPTFLLSLFTFIKRLFSSTLLSAIRVVSLHIWGSWHFSQQSQFQLVLHPAWHFTWSSMSISNCCFLTCIKVSQEADKVIWYSHLFNNFPHFVGIHTKDFV